MTKAVKGVSYLSINKLLQFGTGILSSVLLLRYYGPENMGIWAIANSIIGILGTINLNTAPASQTYIPKYETQNDLKKVWAVIIFHYIINSFFIILISIIAFTFSGAISSFFKTPELSIILKWLALANFITILGGPLTEASLLGLRWYKPFFIISLTTISVNFIIVLVVVFAQYDLIKYAFLTLLPVIFRIVLRFYYLRKIPKPFVIKLTFFDAEFYKISKDIIRFSIPGSANRISFQVYMYLGNIICGKWLGKENTGYFSFALTVVNNINDLIKVIAIILLPIFAETRIKDNAELKKVFQRGYEILLTLSFASSLFLVLFSREITFLIAGTCYLSGVILLQIMAFQPLFRIPTHSVYQFFYSSEKPVYNFYFALAKMIIELSCYLVLIPLLDIIGLSLSVVISYGFILPAAYFYAYKNLHIDIADVRTHFLIFILDIAKMIIFISLFLTFSIFFSAGTIISYLIRSFLFIIPVTFLIIKYNFMKDLGQLIPSAINKAA